MRRILKQHSTKPERIFYEILKRNKISFLFRWIIKGRQVDFLINDIVIEIGNHSQDTFKNKLLLEAGYSTLFFTNKEILQNRQKVEKHLIDKWLKHI